MKTKNINIFLNCVASLLLMLSNIAHAETIVGKVIGVMDGDTIEILDNSKKTIRIRLEGIDAPEKAQPFGNKSKQHLSDLVFGKQVEITSSKTDKYGRSIGKVTLNGVDINLQQLKAGLAWHYKQYQKEQSSKDRLIYDEAEYVSRNIKTGLWSDPNPVPPWDWRHDGKKQTMGIDDAAGCACALGNLCTGSRGGLYCLTSNGKKKY
jgi:endonuclease YncB( thermonuclease family)